MGYDLGALAALEAAATGGEWFVDPEGPQYSVNYAGPLGTFRHVAMVSCFIARHGDKEENETNAALISTMRNALPAMLADIKAMREMLESIQWLEVDTYGYHCPVCFGYKHGEEVAMNYQKKMGHAADCELNKLIGGGE